MSYIGNEPIVSATRTVTEVTATAGQTVFNANGGYTVGYLDVFLNGAQLQTVDFTATNGSSVTLTEAAQVGDVVRLVAWGTFSTSNLVSPNYTGTLTGGTGVVNLGSGQFYKDSSGNVGIGTSSPAYKLQVNGGTSTRISADTTSGTYYNRLVASQTFAYSGIEYSTLFNFVDGATERMRIDSSGNLLVGTTSLGGAGGVTFQVAGSSGATQQIFNRASTTANSGPLIFQNGGTQVGFVQYNNTGTIFGTTSDYRLKENIGPMTGALAKVQSLKPVTYKWIVDGSDGQGFIAHELAEVVPDCVTGEKDAVDAEGNPVYQGIDTSFLVATLTAAIQEQTAIITDLKSRIEALEGSNND